MHRILRGYVRTHIKNAAHAQTGAFYENQPAINSPPETLQSPAFFLTFRPFTVLFFRIGLSVLYSPLSIACLTLLWIGIYGWLYRYDLIDGYWNEMLRSALVPAAIYLLMPLPIVLLSWQGMRKTPAIMSERRVAISPEGLHASGHSYDIRFAWRDLKRVEKLAGIMLFYTPPRGAVPLPLSAFPDKAAAEAFYDQALIYFKAAKVPAPK